MPNPAWRLIARPPRPRGLVLPVSFFEGAKKNKEAGRHWVGTRLGLAEALADTLTDNDYHQLYGVRLGCHAGHRWGLGQSLFRC